MPLLDDEVPPESGAWKSVYCGAGPFAAIGSLATGSTGVGWHTRQGGVSAKRLGGGLVAVDGVGVAVRSITELAAAATAACCTNAAMRTSGVTLDFGFFFAIGGAFDVVCITTGGAADDVPLLQGGVRLTCCHEL